MLEKCLHCLRNTLLPYEYEYTCIACGYNGIKIKHELTENQRMKTNFIRRLKYAEQIIFCICNDVYKIYECTDFSKIYEVLSPIKNKKLKMNNILIEKYKNMIQNPDSAQDYQDYWSRTAIGIYNIGHGSIRLMKWLAYYDRS